MFGLSTAVSALRASQVAMETVGNNIANANTPDYHRQTVHFADRTPVLLGGHLLGRGVDVSHISRSYDSVTEAALTRSLHESADISTRLETARRIESFFQPGAGTLLDRLETFFNDLQRLSASPNDTGLRSIVVRGAAGLTEELNSVSSSLNRLQIDLQAEIQQTVQEINDRSVEIADLNLGIRTARARGLEPNDLLEDRTSRC